ncbi:MAG TPA: DUF4870 domain-containing protein [Aggregatilineaceae bacterium]|nr:DUF4870 domain-containing protein [Aggregatilineaceae bacterium]
MTKSQPSFRGDVAVAHASVILFGGGILIAAIIWAIRKDESRHVSFQAAQAAIWQTIFVLLMFILDRLLGRFLIIGLLLGDDALPLLCYRAFLALVATPFILIGLLAALRTWNGENFHYPLIAQWLENRHF